MAQHVFRGTTPPSFTPTAIGQHYIDTSAKVSYISVGTSGSGDWETSDAADVAGDLATHVADTANPHAVTKFQVGLGNVDNTSDLDKPISTATQAALDAVNSSWGNLTGDIDEQEDLRLQQASLIDGSSSYYFTKTASDLGGGRFTMTKEIPPAGGDNVTATGLSDTDTVATFISVSGFPNVTELPSGPLGFTVKARQSAGTKVTRLYAEFYYRTILGVSTLLSTSNLTQVLTGSSTEVTAFTYMGTTRGLLATDRLEIVIKASITGAGTDPEVVIDIQGNNYSRCKFPYESVSSVAGKVGAVTLVKGDVGLGNVDNTSDLNKPISTATQAALDNKQDLISASNNQFIYSDGTSAVVGHPNLFRDPIYGGTQQTLTPEPDDNPSGSTLNNYVVNVEPLQASVDENYTIHQTSVNLDNNDSGFAFGTSGNSLNVNSINISHQGSGDVGAINLNTNYLNLGNGTDPISVKGFGYHFGFGNVNADVTLNGPIQGYGFQPQINADAIIDTATCYILPFYDFFNAPDSELASYTGFTTSPNIGSIANNSGFTGVNVNPVIDSFTGNAGFTGINVNSTLGAFDTGSFTGINVNPTVTSVDNATGLYVNMSNVTATNKYAADFVGDVRITGNLNFSGSLAIGQLNAFYQANPVDGGGAPLGLHGLVSGMTALDSTTVANADAIGVNTAMLIELEDNSVTTSGPFKLGFAALAMPCVVKTGTGSSLDYMNMAAYALNLDATSTGGTIDRINGVRVEAIPNGVTTVNEFVAFEFNQTFGQVGTDVWGLHIVPTYAENFIGGSLAIGTSTEKVTNSSTALEIGGVTKALLLSRMTTTERNALTAVNGMQIYNTTTDKFQGYANSTWVDLH